MKHLIALSVITLIGYATYLTIHLNSSIWNMNDVIGTIHLLVIDVMAMLTIILMCKLIHDEKETKNKNNLK
jgi:hypothetical protein